MGGPKIVQARCPDSNHIHGHNIPDESLAVNVARWSVAGRICTIRVTRLECVIEAVSDAVAP